MSLEEFCGVYGDYFYMVSAGDKTAFGENLGDTVYWSTKGTEITNFRSQNIKSSENLEKNSLDLYSAYKSLYLQRRETPLKTLKDQKVSTEQVTTSGKKLDNISN
jgi:ABC-type transporter lipoprotein component MlaA